MAASIAIDASVIVRYLTGDDKIQSPAATELFRAAQTGKASLVVPTSTIQETVYVLERMYKLDSATIATKLISLLAIPNVRTSDNRWVMEALQFYRTRNCDFGDALLCAFAQAEGCEASTFDRGIINKFSEIISYTPIDWLAGKTPSRSKQN